MRPLLALALVTAAAPLAAQDERTRLDDFSIAGQGAAPSGDVEQIRPGESPLEAGEQVHDRRVEVTQNSSGNPAERVDQLSSGGTASAPEQLSEAGSVPVLAPTEGRAQSRPQAVQRLAGTDRCDPQLEGAKLDACLRILERRAAQFSAPAAPELSAEQRLLAERQQDERESLERSGDARVRLAGMGTPDADLRSNQELAALVLDRSPPGPLPPAAAEPAPEGLAEILQGLSIEVQQGQTTPQQ